MDVDVITGILLLFSTQAERLKNGNGSNPLIIAIFPQGLATFSPSQTFHAHNLDNVTFNKMNFCMF